MSSSLLPLSMQASGPLIGLMALMISSCGSAAPQCVTAQGVSAESISKGFALNCAKLETALDIAKGQDVVVQPPAKAYGDLFILFHDDFATCNQVGVKGVACTANATSIEIGFASDLPCPYSILAHEYAHWALLVNGLDPDAGHQRFCWFEPECEIVQTAERITKEVCGG